MGFTSGGLILSFTSGGSVHGFHLWWPFLRFSLCLCYRFPSSSFSYFYTYLFLWPNPFLSPFDQVAHAPTGTQACTFDIQKFHRTCPVIPAHKPWLIVQGFHDEFYVDHCHPFGAAAASSNAGMIGNAIVDIWQAEDVKPVLKYEDDLKVFRSPVESGPFHQDGFQYSYNREEALSRIAPLQVPWHKEKGDPFFTFVTDFIGFRWDIPNKRVSLPEGKRLKFLNRVRIFLDAFNGHPCALLDVEKIHGSLCHVAFVYTLGRSRLPSLSNFAASFLDNEFSRRYPPHSLLTDLRWWLQTLDDPTFYRELQIRGPIQDPGLFVDASTSWGIGIIVSGRWFALKLHTDWKTEGRDICWLETIAIEILVYILEAMGMGNTRLIIYSDNQGTIGSFDKGRSRNFHINLSVRRTYAVLASLFITPQLVYVASEANPADPISCGDLGPAEERITVSFSMPDELQALFVDVK
jgi:hypothetical protein